MGAANAVACCSSAGTLPCCSSKDRPGEAMGSADAFLPSARVDAPGLDSAALFPPGPSYNSSVAADFTPGAGLATPRIERLREEQLQAPATGSSDSAAAAKTQKLETQEKSYTDGSVYRGQVLGGKRHGHGLQQSEATTYEGQWKADHQHGEGRQTWPDGRVYEGQFDLGRFSGQGRMVWQTPKGMLIYEGQYQDDLKHGHGKFVWVDGRTYDGEWVLGKRHGRGIYRNARGESKVGYWLKDKFDHWEFPDP